jgi:hypothetical protein
MLFCLLGALVVFRGDELTSSRTRLALGGLAFGVAAAIKVWAVLPILLLSWLCWRSCGRRGVVAYVGGVVAGVAIPVIPFAVMAPDTFFNSVVVAQLSRTDPTRVPILWRLASLSGVTDLSAGGAIVILPSLAIAGLVLAWVAQATRTRHRSLPALDRFVIWSLVAATVAFLLPTDYYPHYAGFFAPFLGLAVALSVAGLSRRLGPTSKRRLIVAATIGVAVMAGVRLVTEVGQSEPAMTAWVDRLVPPGSCVVTDNSSMTIAADRFFSTDPKCSKMVDAFGTSIALADGRNGLTASSRDVRLQAVWLSGLQHARFVWFQCGPAASTSCDERAGTNRLVPWTPEILDYFRHHFRPRAEGPGPLTKRLAYLYARVPG